MRTIEERWVGVGYDVVVEQLVQTDDRGNPLYDAHGLPKKVETTTLVFLLNEPGVNRVIRIPFTGPDKETLMQKLHGGVIVAPNGSIPNL
jgi:hypothetical protein